MTQSRKHTPRVDDDLQRQAEGYLRGAPTGTRAQESRETEMPLDDEPEVTLEPEHDPAGLSDIPLALAPDEIEERSRLGRFLKRSEFPATRHDLIRVAVAERAPDDVVDELRRLPSGETFETPARAFAALGHSMDHRF